MVSGDRRLSSDYNRAVNYGVRDVVARDDFVVCLTVMFVVLISFRGHASPMSSKNIRDHKVLIRTAQTPR
jgi:hypothetical protein